MRRVERQRAAERVAGDGDLAAVIARHLFRTGDHDRPVLARRERSVHRLGRSAVVGQLEQHHARRERRQRGDERRHRARRPAEAVEQQHRRPRAAAGEGVTLHAMSRERRDPALRSLRDHRAVGEAQHQVEREVGHAAQRQLPALRQHLPRRQAETLPLRRDGYPQRGFAHSG